VGAEIATPCHADTHNPTPAQGGLSSLGALNRISHGLRFDGQTSAPRFDGQTLTQGFDGQTPTQRFDISNTAVMKGLMVKPHPYGNVPEPKVTVKVNNMKYENIDLNPEILPDNIVKILEKMDYTEIEKVKSRVYKMISAIHYLVDKGVFVKNSFLENLLEQLYWLRSRTCIFEKMTQMKCR